MPHRRRRVAALRLDLRKRQLDACPVHAISICSESSRDHQPTHHGKRSPRPTPSRGREPTTDDLWVALIGFGYEAELRPAMGALRRKRIIQEAGIPPWEAATTPGAWNRLEDHGIDRPREPPWQNQEGSKPLDIHG